MTPSEAITALCEAADALDKPAIRTLALAAQKVLADDANHFEAVPILFRSESGHKRVAMTWASIETHADGTEESTCGVVEIEGGEESFSLGGLTRESQIVAASAYAACAELARIACAVDDGGEE